MHSRAARNPPRPVRRPGGQVMRGGGKFTNLWLGLLTVGLTVLAFLAAVNIYGQSDQNVKLHAYAAANHANSDAISAVSNARITADDKLIAANTALARR